MNFRDGVKFRGGGSSCFGTSHVISHVVSSPPRQQSTETKMFIVLFLLSSHQ